MPTRSIKVLKTDEQFQEACLHYEVLLHTIGQPSYEVISRLETLINEYELTNNCTPESIEHSHLMNYFLKKSNLTQQELAEKLDVSQPLINRILHDGIKISRKLAHKIAEEFSVTLDLFYSRTTASLY
jgi:plasmid maintenance system antidote protein VapI